MKRQLHMLLTGLLVVVPFAITLWVIWSAGLWLDRVGKLGLRPVWRALDLNRFRDLEHVHGVGVVLLIAAIYLIGVLMHFWLFRRVVGLAERIIQHLPGVKTVYESVRDLMKLFGPESKKMGRVVEYRTGASEVGVLGILTNEQPSGASHNKAAVYFPLAYMVGGPILFVPKKHLREVDMPVERALRLSATAQVSRTPQPDGDNDPRQDVQKPQQ